MARQADIEARIELFLTKLDAFHATLDQPWADYYAPFVVEYGIKNARIVVNAGNSRSVYCFIDLSNGDILKSASWKVPAKGARGSIWNDECDVGHGKPCNEFGSGLYTR